MSGQSGSRAEEAELAQKLLHIVNSSWMSKATYVAAQLGLADLLADGPKRIEALAAATRCNARALNQLMQGLCSLDICSQDESGAYSITPMGRLLGTQARCSIRSWTLYWGGTASKFWDHLLDTVRTGESARSRLLGSLGFEHLARDPEAAKIFNQAMAELTRLVAIELAKVYDFAHKKVVDVGGGYGELLAVILEAYPTARGVLFDMPHAIADARQLFNSRGLAGRCELVEGDFFASLPAGGDIYLLKSVIHDWNDERARVILQNVRRAMGRDAKLLLAERIMPERLTPSLENQALARSDLHMLVALAAQERSRAEFEALLKSAGFTDIRFIDGVSTYCLIEAAPK
ncbi:MAG TPA: methyltransferase [Steroidobacteraceae bacterium]